MKLRLVLSTATLAAFLLSPGESVAQTVGSAASSSQDIETEDLPPLPLSSGHFMELLPSPPPSQGPLPALVQPSGDITVLYARIYFEQMKDERKHRKDRVEITLRDGTRLQGRIVSVQTDRFTMRIYSTKQETSVNFSDLSSWSSWQPAPPNEHIALNLLELAGLELLEIAKLPLTILATLSGPCGC